MDDDDEVGDVELQASPRTVPSSFFSHSTDKRALREEALSELKFKPGIFLRTTFYELFVFPLPLILCTLMENSHSATNRSFNLGGSGGPFLIVLWTGFVCMILGLFELSDEMTVYTALTCIICTLSRAVTLAVKYAFYGNLDIYGEHGLLRQTYTHTYRMHQKLMSTFFYAANVDLSLLAHVEEIYATCLRLDIDLQHMELDLGSKEIAQQIFTEIKAIRKSVSKWQQVVEEKVEQHEIKTARKSAKNMEGGAEEKCPASDGLPLGSNEDMRSKYVVTGATVLEEGAAANGAGHEGTKDGEQTALTMNKYAENAERDLFYRLGMHFNNDECVQEKVERGCVPAIYMAIICERRGYYLGNIWGYEFVGCFFFLSTLVNLIPAFIRMGMGHAAMGTTHISKFLHAGQFLQMSFMWWLIFYYAHSPVLASYGRLRFKRNVTSLISSSGMKFVLGKAAAGNGEDKDAPGGVGQGENDSKENVAYCRLDLTNERNVVAWSAIRHMSHHYAAPMRMKLNIYGVISLATVFLITAMPTIGVTVFGIGTFPIPEHIGNIVRALLVGFSLICSTLYAYCVDYYDMHIRDAVSRNQQHVQAKLAHANAADHDRISRLRNCNMMLTTALKQISVAHKAHPEKVLMLRADPAVCSIIITVLSAALIFDVIRLQNSVQSYRQGIGL